MFKCEFCGKEFKKYQSLAGHKGHCKLNPNFDEEKYKQHQQYALKKAEEKRCEIYKSKRHIYKLICQKCGKEYELNLTEKAFNKGNYSKFCCRSCANSRIRTQETKEKIRNSLNIFYDNKPVERQQIINDINEYNNGNISFDEFKTKHPDIIKICKVCGKEFIPVIQPNGNKISVANTCSNECHKQLTSNISKLQRQKEIENGTFKGWQSRKIISYPEQFWINVLNNNDISFIHNYHFENKYFLDFYI